jgi:hypothetical protein
MARTGKFTASEMWKLFTQPKEKWKIEQGLWGDTANTYIFEKAVEEITGFRKQWSTKATEHGNFNEQEAMDAFKELYGIDVTMSSTDYIPINENCGASPDGIIYESFDKILGVVDVKCPFNPLSYFEQKDMILNTKNEEFQCVPKPYFYQLQTQMLAAKCDKAYLVRYLTTSYTDDFGNKYEYDLPLEARMFCSVVTADKKVQDNILAMVERAVIEKQTIINQLMTKL